MPAYQITFELIRPDEATRDTIVDELDEVYGHLGDTEVTVVDVKEIENNG